MIVPDQVPPPPPPPLRWASVWQRRSPVSSHTPCRPAGRAGAHCTGAAPLPREHRAAPRAVGRPSAAGALRARRARRRGGGRRQHAAPPRLGGRAAMMRCAQHARARPRAVPAYSRARPTKARLWGRELGLAARWARGFCYKTLRNTPTGWPAGGERSERRTRLVRRRPTVPAHARGGGSLERRHRRARRGGRHGRARRGGGDGPRGRAGLGRGQRHRHVFRGRAHLGLTRMLREAERAKRLALSAGALAA
jgi:hypothetical protein